jgi:class 3 adenylate cyclase
MSKAVIGLVGHVPKRLGDGLMALFRYPAAQENDAERTARPFDERGDKIERKGIRGEVFGRGNKRSVVDFFPASGAVEAAAS